MTFKFAYGWKRPSLPDPRKPKYYPHFAGPLPTSIDLRPQCPPVYDQGDLGSCTAQACAGLGEFLMMRQGLHRYVPSRLFIYYNERVIEGTVNEDSGASLSDGATVLETKGCPNEAIWWQNIKKFTVKPSQKVYTDGAKHLVKGVARVLQNVNDMKSTLASGLPFIGGFTVFESFESDAVATTGIMPMPSPREQILGGHAIMVVGYNDATQYFIVRNSWGTGWGQAGYFMMPYSYITNPDLADDFWTATSMGV